jgi:hypothetical protein
VQGSSQFPCPRDRESVNEPCTAPHGASRAIHADLYEAPRSPHDIRDRGRRGWHTRGTTLPAQLNPNRDSRAGWVCS